MNNPYESPPRGGQFDQEPQYATYGEKRQSNPLGLIGFILSLTCLLSPIGLLLSFIGLFKRPRGFAIAGTLIGLVLSFIVIGIAWGTFTFSRLIATMGLLGIQSEVVSQQVEAYEAETGGLPDSLDQVALPASALEDPWGTAYRFNSNVPTQGQFTLSSAGPDGQFGTSDDIDDVAAFMEQAPNDVMRDWMTRSRSNADAWPSIGDLMTIATELEEWSQQTTGKSAIAGSDGAPAIDGNSGSDDDADGDGEGGEGAS